MRRGEAAKGQAALEYITTYGWALIMIMSAVAALAYFGLLKPPKFIPDNCWFGDQLICEDYSLRQMTSTQTQVAFRLKNNLGKNIEIVSVAAIEQDYSVGSCSLPLDIQTKETKGILCVVNNGFLDGEKVSIPLAITFRNNESATTPLHTVRGEIYATLPENESYQALVACSDGIDNDNNGCFDFAGGDTGCSDPQDTTEAGGDCAGSGSPNPDLECFVSIACPYTVVFKISDRVDGHAELPSESNFNYNVCCRSTTATLLNTCSGASSARLTLTNDTEAHVEEQSGGPDPLDACLRRSAGSIQTNYRMGNCLIDETCLASISDTNDAHVGDCVTAPFTERVCLRFI